jgi:hypothetical protein
MASQDKLNDVQLLDVLERAARGESATKIGKALGLTRSSILGLLFRARAPDACLKPENRDGGMPEGWWREGLAKQGSR